MSNDEDSDFSDEEYQDDSDDESYDASIEGMPKYDSKRGEDSWVGRRIVKTFGMHGDFEGIVYGVDADANKKGYRLFLIHYFEDPDDGEAMWSNELVKYVFTATCILIVCS